jgi:threonine/homoserine/homoserine lactone efflux protein
MIEALLSGIVLGLLLAISVGPVIFAIIKQSLNNGHKGGFAFVAGVSASDIAFVLVCNLLTQLFQEAINHKTLIGILGSVFLISLGIYTIFFKKVEIKQESTDLKRFRKRDMAAVFISGFLMNTLNPGAFLFWLAATAKMNTQSLLQEHPLRYLVTAFTTCLLIVLGTDVAKVLLAGKIRTKLTPHNIHIINRISGVILVGFGLVLIWQLVYA